MELKSSIVIKVSENEYQVEHPNMGQIIDIEMLKAQITNGNYGKMVSNLNKMSILSLDIVDMFAHFKIMCPELVKDLRVDNWADLGALDTLEIFKAYKEQFKPWYESFSTKILETWEKITDSVIAPPDSNNSSSDQIEE